MEETDYLTIPQVSRELGAAAQTVHTAISEGRLPFVVKYGRKLVARADVEAYRERTRPDGEKPKGRPRGSAKKQEPDAPAPNSGP